MNLAVFLDPKSDFFSKRTTIYQYIKKKLKETDTIGCCDAKKHNKCLFCLQKYDIVRWKIPLMKKPTFFSLL